MQLERHVAAENVLYLEQGMRLIRLLDDVVYAGAPDGPYRGGVGAQFRHCLDFYDCFLGGLADGRVDYSRRRREREVETSRRRALDASARVRRELLTLTPEQVAHQVEVKSEDTAARGGAAEWSASSVGRELQFLVSHTIHHYALIAALLELRGVDVHRVFPEFGVAPSTLSHWKEADSPAS